MCKSKIRLFDEGQVSQQSTERATRVFHIISDEDNLHAILVRIAYLPHWNGDKKEIGFEIIGKVSRNTQPTPLAQTGEADQSLRAR